MKRSSSTFLDSVPTGSARERLLSAAGTLFYEEGFNTVGIDRVIERAGVAKASLYDCFGSKEALIQAYLTARLETRRSRLNDGLARFRTPRTRLLGVFDVMGELSIEAGYRGCAFIKANAEARAGSAVQDICKDMRAWISELFIRLSAEAGARDPHALARQLMLLYDGATLSSQMDRDVAAIRSARGIAETLLDAATTGR